MQTKRLAAVVGVLACLAFAAVLGSRSVRAQARDRAAARWEYKVAALGFNPGERLTEDARARAYERTLNTFSTDGWEYVGPVLTRDNVQTVGGGVTTRDTVSFVAFRRPKP